MKRVYLSFVIAAAFALCSYSPASAQQRSSHRVEANSSNRHSIYLRSGQYTTVRINGDDDTDLDLFVYDPSGNEVGRDISTDDNESVSLTARRTGNYRIEVRNLGDIWNAYQMWREGGGYNGGGGGGNSGPIGNGQMTRRVEASSANYHSVYVNNGQRVSVRINGDNDTDLDLFVFDPSGNEVARDISTDDDETASFVARRTGAYRVEVRNLGNIWNQYQIWRVIGGGYGGGGGSIGGSRLTRRVEANGQNNHTMYINSGQHVTVRMDGDGDTDLDLFIYDPSGNQVGSDLSGDDNELVSFTARRTGTYRVEVRNLGNVWNQYQIWREVDDRGDDDDYDDIGYGHTNHRVEANGSNNHSMYLRSGQYMTLRIDGDDDTDLDLFVYDAEGREVARDISTDDNETVSFTARRTGTYRVEVRNLGNVWNAYQMWRER